eukprot:scaffold107942_cov45-Phaeocystis_antarctica.AAC.1
MIIHTRARGAVSGVRGVGVACACAPCAARTGGGLGRDAGHAAGGIATHAAEGDWRRYEERERQVSGPAEGDGPWTHIL